MLRHGCRHIAFEYRAEMQSESLSENVVNSSRVFCVQSIQVQSRVIVISLMSSRIECHLLFTMPAMNCQCEMVMAKVMILVVAVGVSVKRSSLSVVG